MDVFNDYFPTCPENSDRYSEWIKAILVFIIVVSLIMMFTYPHGWMYACFPRPFEMIIRFIWNDYTPLMEYYSAPTPEWGLHYTTIVTYALFMYVGIESFEHDKIKKPVHKLCYVFLLTILTLFIPFELVYITLYDIFHSIPKFGFPYVWFFGYWKPFPTNIFDSVILYDVVLPVFIIICMKYVIKELRMDGYNLKFRIDKKALKLFLLFLSIMFLWIIIPIYTDVPLWGTRWFPQTIYIDYGYYKELGIDWGKGEFGIIAEYWHPNTIVKIHNLVSKFVSVLFMFYTFIPRNVNKEDSS